MPRIERSIILDASVPKAYEVVNDVERYPEFLAGCEQVAILETSEQEDLIQVDISRLGFSESFVTRNRSVTDQCIRMELSAGPFSELSGSWSFKPIGEVGCRVELELNYELKGVARLASQMLEKAVDGLVEAFQKRIER